MADDPLTTIPPVRLADLPRPMRYRMEALAAKVATAALRYGNVSDFIATIYMAGVYHGAMLRPKAGEQQDGP